MSHLQLCLTLGTLQVLECHRCESNFELLHDLHHEQANNAKKNAQNVNIQFRLLIVGATSLLCIRYWNAYNVSFMFRIRIMVK